MDEFELDYHSTTRMYHATGGGNRVDAEMVILAQKVWSAAIMASAKGEKPNKTDLFTDLDWPNTGNGARKYNRAYKHALQQDWLKLNPGSRARNCTNQGGDDRMMTILD